jgi:hypothetical protein
LLSLKSYQLICFLKGAPLESNTLSYKNLVVWQKSLAFANLVIDLAENLNTNRNHYRLIEQIEAAATSVPMMG